MTFVKWDTLNEEDKAAYEQLNVIIKDKTVRVEAVNVGRLKPSEVLRKVNEGLNGGKNITQNLHVVLYKLFSVRPANGADDPFETYADFCLYDEPHKDYVYQEAWVNFLIHFMQTTELTPAKLREMLKNNEGLLINEHSM